MPASTMPDGKPLPVIVYNGNIIPDPTSMQSLFEEQMPEARYEVQNYDCQVLNPHYVAEGAQGSDPASGKNMTILVTVSGYVKYGEVRTAAMRGFSESIVLIPNPDLGEGTRGKVGKEWLIQSQNFRLVV
jgi:NTF2-related export protein 1/2